MMKKAVLFDLDGTLLDTLEDLCDSVNRVLTSRDFPTHPLDAYRYYVGDGAATLFRRVLPEGKNGDEMVQKCLMDFREDYGHNWNVKTKPYPGIEELLDALTGRGIRMTVLSNKPDETTKKCIDGLLPRWRFEPVLGQREGVPKKPDPAGALEIIEILKLRPLDFLYLGDTGTDMRTATAAGMFPLGALWGFRTEEELTETGARGLIKEPLELLRHLGD
ncbi:MAG: HAD family hydrolase [Bacteroidota bacterium]